MSCLHCSVLHYIMIGIIADNHEVQRPKTAPGNRRVTFERNGGGSSSDARPPSRTVRNDLNASSDESAERANPSVRKVSPSAHRPVGKKQDDGAWFTDEDE